MRLESDDDGFEIDLAQLLESGSLVGKEHVLEELGLEPSAAEPDTRERIAECLGLASALREASGLLNPLEATRRLPERIGRYEISQLLGEGGLSTVYLAHDPRLDRLVAVKVLREVVGDQDREWIAAEAQVLAQLDSACLLRVLDAGEHNGVPYLISEYVPGPGLDEVIQALRARALTSSLDSTEPSAETSGVGSRARAEDLWKRRSRVRLIERLARALATCHAVDVYHRDIKPGNVLLPSVDRPTLIDFGLAHVARSSVTSSATTSLMGTPAYLAPEQVDSARTGAQPASDQFALAVVLYELVTLEHPFLKGTRDETLRSISAAMPRSMRAVDATIPFDLDWICMKALSRSPADRYPSMADFADDLNAFLEGMAVTARRTPAWRRVTRTLWRRRLPLAAALVGGALAMAGVFGLREVRAREVAGSLLGAALELRGELPRIRTPEDFEGALIRYGSLRARADRIKDGLWSQAANERLGKSISEVAQSLKTELNQELLRFADSHPLPIARQRRLQELSARTASWQGARDLARAEGIETLLDGTEARWTLAPQWEDVSLFEFNAFNAPVSLSLAPTLSPGRYRVVARDPDRVLEVDFEVLEGEWRAASLEPLRVCDPALDWVPLDATRALWITGTPVTQKQLSSCFGEEELEVLDRYRRAAGIKYSSPEDAVRTSSAYAVQFALRLGYRLPSASELLMASRSGLVPLEPGSGSIHVNDRVPEVDRAFLLDGSTLIDTSDEPWQGLSEVGFDAIQPNSVLYLVKRVSLP